METPNDTPSESFGTFPHDAEPFRSFPKSSEVFGTFPKLSERKENHILTVKQVARMFEDASVARTERSITNWCQPDNNGVGRLDCYLDPNERKYLITPESVDRVIAEEQAKIVPHDSEAFRTLPNTSETPIETDEIAELRREKRDLEITNKAKDYYITQLQSERGTFLEEALKRSERIGELEQKLLQLKAPERTEETSNNNQ